VATHNTLVFKRGSPGLTFANRAGCHCAFYKVLRPIVF
jgi:hypothetical protein